jgi:hypothetical protein
VQPAHEPSVLALEIMIKVGRAASRGVCHADTPWASADPAKYTTHRNRIEQPGMPANQQWLIIGVLLNRYRSTGARV